MGISRRFLNLIVDNRIPGGKSLNCIDLRRHKLFNTRTPPVLPPAPKGDMSEPQRRPAPQDDRNNNYNKLQAAASPSTTRKIRTIQLPQPIRNLRSSIDDCHWYLTCLPLAGRKVMCVDPSAHAVLFDVVTRQLDTVPRLSMPRRWPLPCWVPLPSSADATDDGNGSFYILEASPVQELQGVIRQCEANQFEAFVYHSESKSWQRQFLPPPPFATDPKHYEHCTRPKITSYAVVERGGSHVIIVSVDGDGTYCLDTVTHTWSCVGDWVLPFTGEVEYVPELKLWFGICAEGNQLGAADLSAMDSQPQIVGTWKEIEVQAGWLELKPPQLVSLGSGRFCITRFYRHVRNPIAFSWNYIDCFYDSSMDEDFTVFTGVDVVPRVHDIHGTASATGNEGKVELQMIKHNSRRHISDGSDRSAIEKVF